MLGLTLGVTVKCWFKYKEWPKDYAFIFCIRPVGFLILGFSDLQIHVQIYVGDISYN